MHPEDIGQYVSDSTFEIIGIYVFQLSYALDVRVGPTKILVPWNYRFFVVFKRSPNESTHESNARYIESIENVKALGGDVPGNYKQLITYLHKCALCYQVCN